MRIWGKDIARTKYVGQVYTEQLASIRKQKGVLHRIASRCENCRENAYYSIYETSRLFSLFNIPLVQCDTVYFFNCPECNYGFKLEPDEFRLLEKLAIMNTKYLEGSITKTEYENGLKDIQE